MEITNIKEFCWNLHLGQVCILRSNDVKSKYYGEFFEKILRRERKKVEDSKISRMYHKKGAHHGYNIDLIKKEILTLMSRKNATKTSIYFAIKDKYKISRTSCGRYVDAVLDDKSNTKTIAKYIVTNSKQANKNNKIIDLWKNGERDIKKICELVDCHISVAYKAVRDNFNYSFKDKK